jgi:hypothetical protein
LKVIPLFWGGMPLQMKKALDEPWLNPAQHPWSPKHTTRRQLTQQPKAKKTARVHHEQAPTRLGCSKSRWCSGHEAFLDMRNKPRSDMVSMISNCLSRESRMELTAQSRQRS